MVVGIHQPNFLPWMGYFDKMDRSDVFILLDEVQLSDSDMTQRSRVLNVNGEARYLTVAFEKKGYMRRELREVGLNHNIDWQQRHLDYLKGTYGKARYYDEVMELLHPIWYKNYDRLIDVNLRGIQILREILGIETKLIFQSSIDYNRESKKSELVLDICRTLGADKYLSGTGARKYLDVDAFHNQGMVVEFQRFEPPCYSQISSEVFVPGLSLLDVLLNCGIDETRRLFQNRVIYR